MFQAFVLKTAAYDAICATLPLGIVGYESEPNERCEHYVWLEDTMAARRDARAGRELSAVILRIARREALATRGG